MYDRSDARGHNADGRPGVGVGFAPTPSDGRSSDEENQAAHGIPDARLEYMLGDTGIPDTWPDDPSDARGLNADGMRGIGAQSGSPALDYAPALEAGYDAVDSHGIDGGMSDQVRRGFTPARRPLTRYLFWRAPWKPEIEGEFARSRPLVGEYFHPAAMPTGRMSPMDEYRLLTSGEHA